MHTAQAARAVQAIQESSSPLTFGQDVLSSCLQCVPLLLQAEAWDARCRQGDRIVPAENQQ